MKLIDKAVLVAEIVRRRREIPKNETDKALRAVYGNEAFVLTELLSFLDTIEVKEVDLEKEVEKCLKQYKMLAVGKKDFTTIAKYFFELGLSAQKGE